MRFSKALALPFLAGFVAAIPSGYLTSPEDDAPGPSSHEVEIRSIAFAGSGCPAGTVAGQLSSDLTTITILFDSFIAQSGAGIPATEFRKNCQLNVKIQYPQGWQFSIFKADYRGFALIPEGSLGTCKATYYFSGDSHSISSTLLIPGPFIDNYIKTDEFGIESTVWSPCGAEGLLNINSEIRISPISSQSALLTVDSTDLKFSQIHYLQWKKCDA